MEQRPASGQRYEGFGSRPGADSSHAFVPDFAKTKTKN